MLSSDWNGLKFRSPGALFAVSLEFSALLMFSRIFFDPDLIWFAISVPMKSLCSWIYPRTSKLNPSDYASRNKPFYTLVDLSDSSNLTGETKFSVIL